MPTRRSSTDPAPLGGAIRRTLLAATAAGSAGGCLLILQCLLLGRAVDDVISGGAGPAGLASTAAWFLAAAAARAWCVWRAESLGGHAAAAAQAALRTRAIAGMVDRGPTFREPVRAGDIVQTLTGGIDAVDAYVAQYLPQAALALIVPLAVLIAVVALDPLSAVVLGLTGPLMPLFMWLIGSTARARTRRQWLTLARLSARFLDAIRSVGTLNAFGAAEAEARVLEEHGRRFRAVTLGILKVAFLSALVLELVATLGVAIVAVEAGLRLLYGRMAFRDAFTVLLLSPEFYRPLRTLASAFHAGLTGREAIGRAAALAADSGSPPGRPAPGALRPAMSPVAGADAGVQAHRPPRIRFDHVSFSYAPDASPVIRDLSFGIAPGTTLALVGRSGSGKTTVARLLLGFLRPQSGSIAVDGMPLPSASGSARAPRIAWLPQHPHLFHGSVIENVRLGVPEASEREVLAALEKARATEFVLALPDGLHTTLGDSGERLSSGQRQRIAMARAFLTDAPLLVMDEPTAFLDPDSEGQVCDALADLRSGRTVLLIAHRLSTVAAAQTVAVLHDGAVIEHGSPGDLLAANGAYAAMVRACGAMS